MSVADIFDEMESYNRRLENSFKRALSIAFTQAESTAEHVGRYLNEKNTARAPWDFFPTLFREEKELYERKQGRIGTPTQRKSENAGRPG